MRKFLPYILILVIAVGLFSSAGKVNAQLVTCTFPPIPGLPTIPPTQVSATDCTALGGTPPAGTPTTPATTPAGTLITCTFAPAAGLPTAPARQLTAADCASAGGTPTAGTPALPNNSAFENNLEKCFSLVNFSINGCVKNLFYLIFYQVPAALLWISAYFFNVMISVSLSSTLFTHAFVSTAWGIVRDLSNLFFIIILLYIAIKIILDIGGSDAKRMIVQVIIMALLINFSMFMTSIVIDTSNILALIFYNKLDVNTSVNGVIRPYAKVTANDKDVAGGMVSAFDPTSRLNTDFFTQAKKQWDPVTGAPIASATQVPIGTMITLILLAGAVMAFAAYALFISGMSFVGRLIELWVLIIFSPFAFMSFALPKLRGMEYLGWDSWLKRLLTVSFMAPIFMFFLYFIFLLIRSNIYKDIVTPSQPGGTDPAGVIKLLLAILLPTALILILLLKATEFAKKGSGAAGAAIIKGGQIVGGLAVASAGGLALGGGAALLQGTVGKFSSRIAESERAQRWQKEGKFGAGALRTVAKYGATSSFDARKGAVGAVLGGFTKVTGVNLGQTSKFLTKDGGYEADRKKMVEKRQKRAKEFTVSEDEPLKQELNTFEAQLQGLLHTHSDKLHELNLNITEAKDLFDNTTGTAKDDAGKELKKARDERSKFKKDEGISDLERNKIPEAKLAIENENRSRQQAYAERTARGGGRIRNVFRAVGIQQAGDNSASRKEAAHKIIMGAKIEDKPH